MSAEHADVVAGGAARLVSMRWTDLSVEGSEPEGPKPVRVWVTPTAWAEVTAHARRSGLEEGGLLLGHVRGAVDAPHAARAQRGRKGTGTGRFTVVVERAIPATDRRATGVSFAFVPGTWEALIRRWRTTAPDLELVGWFHSHPNLSAFFSGTDRMTQRQCFRRPWHVGLVVDPVRDEHACYVGPDSLSPDALAVGRKPAWVRQTLLRTRGPGSRPTPTPRPRTPARLVALRPTGIALLYGDGSSIEVRGLVTPWHAGSGRRPARLRGAAWLAARRVVPSLRRKVCRAGSGGLRVFVRGGQNHALPAAGGVGERCLVSDRLGPRRAGSGGRREVADALARALVQRGLALIVTSWGGNIAERLQCAQHRAATHGRGVWGRRARRILRELRGLADVPT